MGFRALLFSKSVETDAAMTTACASSDLRLKSLSDIFNAIEQVKKSKYSCIIVDWADQPEANFLLKRARESAPNRETIAIVIVDHEPGAAEMHDNHLDLLIYRPISQNEAGEVLAKAREKMQPSGAEDDHDDVPDAQNAASSEQTHAATGAGELSQRNSSDDGEPSWQENGDAQNEDVVETPAKSASTTRHWPVVLAVCSAVAIAAAIYAIGPRDAADRVARIAKGTITAIQHSAAAAFYKPKIEAAPIRTTTIDYQADQKVTDSSANAPVGRLNVVATASTLLDAPAPLPKAFDFPMPDPTFERPAPPPVRVARAPIPESMRTSPPIAPPIVVTVNPAQMMPVSHSLVPPATQQVTEPVALTEETERALLVRSVNPTYPPEGAAQKLHGPVVLQALIGRDGTVEDLKIIRGYFILGKAASAAVKQWRFQPYTVNGHAVSTQTTITINFTYPPG